MNEIVADFYSGYESEPEIQFIKVSAKDERKTIRIWSGYFDDMMDQFISSPQGWIIVALIKHNLSMTKYAV